MIFTSYRGARHAKNPSCCRIYTLHEAHKMISSRSHYVTGPRVHYWFLAVTTSGARRREFKIDWDVCAADKKSPRPSCFQSNTLGTEYLYERRQLLWLG
jgi:hypothetical protein